MRLIHLAESRGELVRKFLATSRFPVHRAEPAQGALQIACDHTAKLVEPVFESAVVRMDILHASDAVGAEDNVPRQERLQRGRQRRHVDYLQDTISTGICSCESPGLAVRPPRLRAYRSRPLRFPCIDPKVSVNLNF